VDTALPGRTMTWDLTATPACLPGGIPPCYLLPRSCGTPPPTTTFNDDAIYAVLYCLFNIICASQLLFFHSRLISYHHHYCSVSRLSRRLPPATRMTVVPRVDCGLYVMPYRHSYAYHGGVAVPTRTLLHTSRCCRSRGGACHRPACATNVNIILLTYQPSCLCPLPGGRVQVILCLLPTCAFLEEA